MAVVPKGTPVGEANKVGCLVAIASSGRLINADMVIAMSMQTPPTHFSMGYMAVKGFPVEIAREKAAEAALELKAKYLWFVDDDTIPPMNAVRRLIYILENYPEIAVCGGVYVTKSDPTQPVVFRGSGQGSFWRWKAGDVFEVTGMGAGCMLIRTSVFNELKRPWFAFTQEVSYDGIHAGSLVSEDIGFCDAVRKAGYKVFAHGGVLCDHFDASTGVTYVLPADSYPMRPETRTEAEPLPLEDCDETKALKENK
jgi:hypothetical protein